MLTSFYKNIALVLFLLILLLSCKSDRFSSKETVIIKGSDTMVNLTLTWAENLMQKDQSLSIQVTGGGSGTGIAAILNGTADVANVSRDLKERELQKAAKLGVEPILHKAALDGIAIVVNPSNDIDTLTIPQIRDIFSGKVNNWKEVGGNDLRIVLYGRENSSGTYEYFKSVILKTEKESQDFATSTQVLQGTSSLAEAVALDRRGIGYGGVGYFTKREDVKIIYIKSETTKKAISPVQNGELNYRAIWNGEYPLSRFLYCLTNGEPKGAAKKYIEFISSDAGQKLVEEMEYIPLPNSIELEVEQ